MKFKWSTFEFAKRVPWKDDQQTFHSSLADAAREAGRGEGTEEEAAFLRLVAGTRETWEIGVGEIKWHARYVAENLKKEGYHTLWDVYRGFPDSFVVRGIGPGTRHMLEMMQKAIIRCRQRDVSAEDAIQPWMRRKKGSLPDIGKSGEDHEVRQ